MPEIHIAAGTDNYYVQHSGVMLCSLFENAKHDFHIHIIHDQLSEDNCNALRQLVKAYGHQITFYQAYLDNPEKYLISGHITIGTYFKILLPKFITDKDITKILYLDGDIIVKQDILPLWKKDINEFHMAAVEDVTVHRQTELMFDFSSRYFNAGVLLVNLQKWREDQIMEKTLSFIWDYPDRILFWDQDALNAILHDKWLPLHPKYNMQAPLFMEEFESYYGDPRQLEEAIKDPVIIHYSAPLKPWHYLSYHPYTSEYYKYLSLTPWKDFTPTDKNWIRVIRKYSRPFLRKLGIKKVFNKHLY